MAPASDCEWDQTPGPIQQLNSGQHLGPVAKAIHARAPIPAAGRVATFFAVLGTECPPQAPPETGTNDSNLVVKTITPPITIDTTLVLVDMVAVTAFTLSVDQPRPGQDPSRPEVNQSTSVKMTIANLRPMALNVPWQIIVAGGCRRGKGLTRGRE